MVNKFQASKQSYMKGFNMLETSIIVIMLEAIVLCFLCSKILVTVNTLAKKIDDLVDRLDGFME